MSDVKPNWTIWTVFILAATFVFQFDSLLARYDDFYPTQDLIQIPLGYAKAVQHGTAQWWYGPWINLEMNYFRPLTSYVYMAEVWTMRHAGFTPLAALTILGYGLLSCLVGCFTLLLTEKRAAALTTALGFAALHPAGRGWLAYWVISDNLVCLAFILLALCALLAFMKHPTKAGVVWLWLAVIGGCLSKEQAYILPILMAALVGMLPREKGSHAALVHSGFMIIGCAMVFKYARAVVPVGQASSPALFVQNFTGHIREYGFVQAVLVTDYWLVVMLKLAALIVPAIILWRSNLRPHWLTITIALFVCANITTIPTEYVSLPMVDSRRLFAWMFLVPAVSVAALHLIDRPLRALGRRRPKPSPAPSPQDALPAQ